LIGQEPVWDDGTGARYKRGSPPLSPEEPATSLERILNSLAASQEQLREGLSRLTEEELSTASEGKTLLDKLFALQFHETYHCGQVGLLRRLTGKPGAIQ